MRVIGVIGGSGMLGSAIVDALLARGGFAPERLWVSNRRGVAPGLPGVNVTASNQALVEAADLVVLSVPPAAFADLAIDARGKLVLSVMAGVTRARLHAATGAERVVRAMSSPAAALGLAYSPWVASPALDAADRAAIRALFEPCGLTDELEDEALLEFFTAMTGPVPGFVAFFAECMAKAAAAEGVPAPIADRAVRQLFLASGRMLAEGAASPADHVQEMIDYAGTTAEGLKAMRASSIEENVKKGLAASIAKTRAIAEP